MIYKSTSPISPAVTVQISGVEVDYTAIMGADLVLEENKHDLLVLKLVGVPPSLINQYLNAPVLFSLDSGPLRSQQFTGYVSNVEPVTQSNHGYVNNSSFQEVHLYCVGASYFMKGLSSKVWNPPTLNNVVTSMSKKYGFSADFPRDSYAPLGLAQTAESDWSFLVKAANKYSYRVSVHGTHIHVWDVYKATGRASSYHELIAIANPGAAQPCMILKFEAYLGALSSSGYSSSTTVSYLDSQGNSLPVNTRNVRTDSGLGKKFVSTFENFSSSSTQSFEDAQRDILRLRKANMPFSAHVEITAGAGIVPGGIVNVLNYGSEFDGLWYVKSVKHVMGQSHYVTHLEITKDALFTPDINITPITKFKTPPEPIVVNNRWVARTRRVTEYA